MLLTLIGKEIRNNLVNARFLVAYFATTVLVVGSAAVMLGDYLGSKAEYEMSRNLYNAQMADARIHDLWFRNYTARPPSVFGIFAAGSERVPDDRALVNHESSPHFRGELKRSPLPVLFPPVDLVFVVGVILSLLVLLLTFDAVAGEREEGVLRLLLASPIPRDSIIVAKWLGGFVSLMMPFVVSITLVLLMLVLTPSITLSGDTWLRIGGMLLAFVLYLAVIFSLSLFCSVLFKRSATVALALLLVWVTMALLIPGLSVPIARAMHNPKGVRTREVAMLRSAFIEECTARERESEQRRALFDERYGGRGWRQLSKAEQQEWWSERTIYVLNGEERCFEQVLEESHAISNDELVSAHTARWLARLSPFGCLQNACLRLAGTGVEHEAALRTSLEGFGRETWRFYRDWTETAPSERPPIGRDMPRYKPPHDRLGPSSADILVDLGLLALMGILSFIGAYALFVRMDVT
jgi:ABC-type multidrug transport system permease subunit